MKDGNDYYVFTFERVTVAESIVSAFYIVFKCQNGNFETKNGQNTTVLESIVRKYAHMIIYVRLNGRIG